MNLADITCYANSIIKVYRLNELFLFYVTGRLIIIIELELLKVGKRSSRYLSLPDGRGGGSRSTSPRFSSPAGSQSSLISKSLVKLSIYPQKYPHGSPPPSHLTVKERICQCF